MSTKTPSRYDGYQHISLLSGRPMSRWRYVDAAGDQVAWDEYSVRVTNAAVPPSLSREDIGLRLIEAFKPCGTIVAVKVSLKPLPPGSGNKGAATGADTTEDAELKSDSLLYDNTFDESGAEHYAGLFMMMDEDVDAEAKASDLKPATHSLVARLTFADAAAAARARNLPFERRFLFGQVRMRLLPSGVEQLRDLGVAVHWRLLLPHYWCFVPDDKEQLDKVRAHCARVNAMELPSWKAAIGAAGKTEEKWTASGPPDDLKPMSVLPESCKVQLWDGAAAPATIQLATKKDVFFGPEELVLYHDDRKMPGF